MDVDRSSRLHLGLLAAFLLGLGVSAIRPYDPFTWFLEVVPALIALPILLLTYRRFRFTDLLYVLMTLHALVLVVGGHYTYARVPVGDWARDAFGLSRNHYDRFGHFMQGFVPVMIARELLLRRTPLRPGGWLSTLCVCAALAVSSLYELLEWTISVLTGSAGDAFLGTQGDVFDTQKDMAMAFLGALVALVALGRLHDRSLERRRAVPQGAGSRPVEPHGRRRGRGSQRGTRRT
jgi:putative membrane protein